MGIEISTDESKSPASVGVRTANLGDFQPTVIQTVLPDGTKHYEMTDHINGEEFEVAQSSDGPTVRAILGRIYKESETPR